MPCQNTLEPAVGCRGPGTDTACDYCKEIEKKRRVPPPRPPRPLKPQQASALIQNASVIPGAVPIKRPALFPCVKPPWRPPYRLVRLDIARACGGPGSWWQVVSADKTVEVKATTSPSVPAAWARLNWGTNVLQVNRSAVGTQNVTCRMDAGPAKSLSIDVYDLTALTPSAGAISGNTVKVYESNASIVITAATNPDEAKVWQNIQWKGQVISGPQDAPVAQAGPASNQFKVLLSRARDVKVTATLGCYPAWGQKTLEAIVHICKWPNLEVQQVEFDSRPVLNDGTKEIGKAFDKKWIKGRPDPAVNCVTASCQSPICYPANEYIRVSVDFNVLQQPTEDEDVWVCGVATCGGTTLQWREQITVKAAATKVRMLYVTSDNPLPDGVARYNPFTIKWYMTESDNATWRSIGSTTHLLYVTLGEPATTEAYWTLLDISCQAAAGKTTENDFVPAAFAPFKTHTGDGKGFRRKGDGVDLSYYKDGVKTGYEQSPKEKSPYWTKGILARSDGTGRCGGWANLLITMFQLHGVTSALKYAIICEPESGGPNYDNRFLVKQCSFTPIGHLNCGPYTHIGNKECTKDSGAPGQGKTNPQFDFADHVFVEHNNQFFDPSYGLGPLVGQFAYEEAAIDGLGTYTCGAGQVNFTKFGTPQHIPGACSPGFVVRVVSSADKITDIAKRFGVTAQAILDHPMNKNLKALRLTVANVQVGDVVYLARAWARAGKRVMLYGYYS